VFSVQGFSVQELLGGEVIGIQDGLMEECIRMLNGLEKSLEKHLPESERRWTAQGVSSLLNSEY